MMHSRTTALTINLTNDDICLPDLEGNHETRHKWGANEAQRSQVIGVASSWNKDSATYRPVQFEGNEQ